MERREFVKNRLDMEYRHESQKSIVFITLGTISVLGFLGVMLAQEHEELGATLALIFAAYALFMYVGAKRKMAALLQRIERL